MEPVDNCYKGLLYSISDSNEAHKGYLYGFNHLIEGSGLVFDRNMIESFNSSKSLVVALDLLKHNYEFRNFLRIYPREFKQFTDLTNNIFIKRMGLHVIGDSPFIKKAHENDITIYDLETVRSQIFSVYKSIILMKEINENEDKFNDYYLLVKKIIHAGKNGLEIEESDLNEFKMESLFNRNHRMSEKINSILEGNANPFIALNYEHFLGKESIANLLKSKGWTIKKL